MSDEYVYITFNDVMRFLNAKVPVQQCPSCTSQDWTLQYGRLAGNADLVFSTSTLVIGPPLESLKGDLIQTMPLGRPILPLICNACGYVKIHDYAIVKKWIEANPAEATDADP